MYEQLKEMSIEAHWSFQHLKIHTGAYCHFNKEPSNCPHFHKYAYELCYVISGTGIYYHGEDTYNLRAGDLFISNPCITHEITSHATRDLHIVFFLVFPSSSQEPTNDIFESQLIHSFLQAHHVHSSNQHHLQNYLDLLHTQATGSTFEKYRQEKALLHFNLDALATLCSGTINEQSAPDQLPSPLHLALTFIMQHLHTPLHVSDIATASCCSERHLRRLFSEHFNHTLTNEIHRKRIHHASRLLMLNLPISQVAAEIGIPNHSQFSRLFKRITNLSPKAYQQKYLTRR